jgi:hypothetical protein
MAQALAGDDRTGLHMSSRSPNPSPSMRLPRSTSQRVIRISHALGSFELERGYAVEIQTFIS